MRYTIVISLKGDVCSTSGIKLKQSETLHSDTGIGCNSSIYTRTNSSSDIGSNTSTSVDVGVNTSVSASQTSNTSSAVNAHICASKGTCTGACVSSNTSVSTETGASKTGASKTGTTSDVGCYIRTNSGVANVAYAEGDESGHAA